MISRISAVAACVISGVLLAGTTAEFNPRQSDLFERGYYVPENLKDAIGELQAALSDEAKTNLRNTEENRIAARYHEALGSWIRRHWLYKGSRLREFFASQGIQSRDGASMLIIEAVWRRVRGRPVEPEQLLAAARHAEQAMGTPENLTCPDRIGEEMEVVFKFVMVDPVRVVHVARCPSTGDFWAFEINKGWSRPDADTMAKINAALERDAARP